MYQVTIAIPLYNAEKYIRKTMERALEQTYKSIEFLIIDDRGNDKSIEIIQELQQQHHRGKDIRIVTHEINRGIAAVRNTAIIESKGNYLFFLDSDDLITYDCIEILYNAIEKENAEVVYASHEEVWENGKRGSRMVLPHKVFNQPDELASFKYGQLKQVMGSFIWNVLYRLSFIRSHQLQFQPVTVWEDMLFHFDLTPLVTSCVLLPNITYTYIRRDGSLSQYNSRNQISLKEIEQHLFIRNYCKNKLQALKDKPYNEFIVTWVMMLCMETAATIIDKRKIIVPELPMKEVKKLLKHPLLFKEIILFKRYRLVNTGLLCLGKLPSPFITLLLTSYLKLLKSYRNLKKK